MNTTNAAHTKSSESSPRIALITGGSRGLGRSMALHLADHGVDSIITYHSNEAEAKAVVDAVIAKGRKSAAIRLDVGDSKSFSAFTESVRGALAKHWQRDRFDFLVNNAGTGAYASFADTKESDLDHMYAIHLKGPFLLTQGLLPVIADGGRILNVSSGLTRFTMPGYAAYAAMKGGVEVLTHYMAKELGARKISVNTLAPGAIETDFGGGTVRDNAEVNKMIASQTALGRVGLPDDIGGAAALLLAPEALWLNGQRIEFAGGIAL